MTPQQKTALADPCFAAEDRLKAKFSHRLNPPRDDMSITLTVNIGLASAQLLQSRELWMASVETADRQTGQPKAVADWSAEDLDYAKTLAESALRRVGVRSLEHVETGDTMLAIRRAMTDGEILQLPRTEPGSTAS